MIHIKIGSAGGLTLHKAKFSSWTDAGKWIDGVLESDDEAEMVLTEQDHGPTPTEHVNWLGHKGFLG